MVMFRSRQHKINYLRKKNREIEALREKLRGYIVQDNRDIHPEIEALREKLRGYIVQNNREIIALEALEVRNDQGHSRG